MALGLGAQLQAVDHDAGAHPGAHHRADRDRGAGLDLQAIGQGLGDAGAIGAGVDQEAERPLAVEGDGRDHPQRRVATGGDPAGIVAAFHLGFGSLLRRRGRGFQGTHGLARGQGLRPGAHGRAEHADGREALCDLSPICRHVSIPMVTLEDARAAIKLWRCRMDGSQAACAHPSGQRASRHMAQMGGAPGPGLYSWITSKP